MKNKISSLALILCLAGPMAFAGEKHKTKTESTEAQSAQTSKATPCAPATDKSTKEAQPAPSDQEQEFNRVLMGIYG